MENDMKNESEPQIIVERKGSGITPFLIGLAVGAGLALLFAPQSGVETRRSLARGARKMRDAAQDAVDDVAEQVGDTIDTARERVAEGIESARERVTDGIESARDAVAARRGSVKRAMNAGRAAAAQAREDLERRLSETKAAYQAGARVARESATRDD